MSAPRKKSRSRDSAASAASTTHEHQRIEREHNSRQLRSWIGVSEAPTYRSAGANLEVRDVASGLR